MREIPLSQGLVARVDDDDFTRVAAHRWHAVNCDGKTYARAHIRIGTGKYGKMYMHRFIIGARTGQKVDHHNGNGLHNNRGNLRVCTQGQNLANQRKTRGVSRYKGVSWHKGDKRWRAYIKSGRRYKHLGNFTSEQEAAAAYNEAAQQLWGDFALLNTTCVT